jgi:6-phosphogluconolactonase
MERAGAGGATAPVKLRILSTAAEAATAAAGRIAQIGRDAVAARNRFTLALSGGSTPLPMFDELVRSDVPWSRTHVFQADERVAPRGAGDRNLTALETRLTQRVRLPADRLHPMPVDSGDVRDGAARYEDTLRHVAGLPPILDVVHLGLGPDGHTASLVPGDPVVAERDHEVAFSQAYQGRRRMTLTIPLLSRARHLVWLVCGSAKAGAVLRLLIADPTIPAGQIAMERAELFVDEDAAALLDPDQLP